MRLEWRVPSQSTSRFDTACIFWSFGSVGTIDLVMGVPYMYTVLLIVTVHEWEYIHIHSFGQQHSVYSNSDQVCCTHCIYIIIKAGHRWAAHHQLRQQVHQRWVCIDHIVWLLMTSITDRWPQRPFIWQCCMWQSFRQLLIMAVGHTPGRLQ